MNRFGKKEFVDVFDVVLIITIGSFFLIGIFVLLAMHHTKAKEALSQKAAESEVAETKPYVDPFAHLNLEAKAVYVFDPAENKAIFSYNSQAALPLASLTKI